MRALLRRSLELQQRFAVALTLPRDHVPRWAFALALLAICLFGAWLRAAYYLTHDLESAYFWRGHLTLTSSDGFYFATGVGHALTDAWGASPRVPTPDLHALVALTAGLAKLTGISVEALYTWLPVVLGPLIALPIALYGRLSGRSVFGLLAALFAVCAPTYAIRTSVGYFDTDLFSVTVPLLVAVLFARALSSEPPWTTDSVPSPRPTQPPSASPATAAPSPAPLDPRLLALRTRSGQAAALVLSVYVFFYDQGISIGQVMGLVFALALALQPALSRLSPTLIGPLPTPTAATLATSASLANFPFFWPFRLLAALAALLVLPRLTLGPRLRIALAALVTVGALLTGEAFQKLLIKVEIYTENQRPDAASEPAAPSSAAQPERPSDAALWKSQDTTGLVAEAKVFPFADMARRAAGHPLIFVTGLLGAVLLLLARPSLAPLAPLLAVGLFAFMGGHRFLIYLVPLIGLGLAFIALHSATLLARLAPKPRRAIALHTIATLLVVGAAARPALIVANAPPSPAIIVPEIEALEALDRLSTPNDVTLAWWDFGYPIAYFGHTRTITDGSLRGDDAALVAELLMTDSPELAQKLALLAADALDQSPAAGAAAHLFGAAKEAGLGPVDFLAAVRAGRWPIPDPPHDVYLYLPLRMIPIIQALELYRPSGVRETRKRPYVRLYRNVSSEAGKLHLEDGLEVDSETVAMWRTNARGQREKKPLHSIHVVTGSGSEVTRRSKPGDPGADTAGVLLRDLRIFIEVEPRVLSSVWASLFLFGRADPQRFEPVFANEAARIYKVRRIATPRP